MSGYTVTARRDGAGAPFDTATIPERSMAYLAPLIEQWMPHNSSAEQDRAAERVKVFGWAREGAYTFEIERSA